MKNCILFSAIFAASAAAQGCNGDNVLRCLRGSSAAAVPYCSSYLLIPVATQVISTFTPVTTITSMISVTSVVVTSTTTSTTQTSTIINAPAFKRSESEESIRQHLKDAGLLARAAPSVVPPKCLSQVSNSLYPASRISSACSCFVATSTQSVTATAPTSTATSYSTVTATETSTFITIVSATQTRAVCTPTAGSSIQKTIGGGITGFTYYYREYYRGSGFTESKVNSPAGPNLESAPATTIATYPGDSTTDCQAVFQCADNSFTTAPGYFSFDVHFLKSSNTWECIGYYLSRNDPANFNVLNSDVTVAYGYALGS